MLGFGILVAITVSSLWNPSSCSSSDGTSLRVGAFNIQIFGGNKMQQPQVVDVLVKIVRRYDIILIQEIRDSTQTAIYSLLTRVNHGISHKYDMVISPRLGRSTSKEQYAYLYRNDRATVTTTYLYSDHADVFEREPYIALFKWNQLSFFLVGIHTSPGKAETEIDHLVGVYDHARKAFNIDDAMILGDFNAGCSYVTNTEWSKIRLATDKRFYWLIGNDVDTTTSNSDCPYDRFVAAGSKLIKTVLPMSPHAFNYAKVYGLTDTLALSVSDHYPVEVTLEQVSSQARFKDQKSLITHHPSSGHFSKSDIYTLRRDASGNPAYSVSSVYTSSGAYNLITVSIAATGRPSLIKKVIDMRKDFPQFISQSQVDSIAWRSAELQTFFILPDGKGRYLTLKDFYEGLTAQFHINLECSVVELSCRVSAILTEV